MTPVLRALPALVLGLSLTSAAAACSCAPAADVAAAVQGATAVFRGQVVQTAEVQVNGLPRLAVAMDLDASWKGATTRQVELTTATMTPACGYPFRQGQTYIVYAFGDGPDWRTNTCTRTREASEEEAIQLGPPLTTFDEPQDEAPDEQTGPDFGGLTSQVAPDSWYGAPSQ